jgi:polyphosphate kinase
MPKDLLKIVTHALGMSQGLNTIPGGRYHNFKDFISFPKFNNPAFLYVPQAPVKHPELENPEGIIHTVLKKDVLLHFPYQRFDYVTDLLREAALDPKVKSVKINIYRIARNSDIMNAILSAAFNGKEVVVVMELQARFDEQNNLYWANRLKEFGVKVIYGRRPAAINLHRPMPPWQMASVAQPKPQPQARSAPWSPVRCLGWVWVRLVCCWAWVRLAAM